MIVRVSAASLLVLGLASGVQAASDIRVTTAADELNSDGDCSLREAIRAANTNAAVDACASGSASETDRILLQRAIYKLSLGPAGDDDALNGDLDVTGDTALVGLSRSRTVVDGAGLDRVFHVPGSASLSMSRLTVRGGNLSGGGGGLRFDGSVLNVSRVNLLSNRSTDGGGLEASGTVMLDRVTFSGNDATTGSGGGFRYNGGAGSLTGTNLIISNNQAGNEGGGAFTTGPTTLSRTLFEGNRATGPTADGGGIRQNGQTLTVMDSAFVGNSAAADGGGVVNAGATIALTNVTLSGNTAGGQGGGLGNTFGGSTMSVNHATISGNTAPSGGGIAGIPISIRNSIVASNTGGGNCDSPHASQGHNIESAATCGFTAAGDRQNTNPRLRSLADNGGPTPTHALRKKSSAIDRADPAGCGGTDQRGVPRPRGKGCDIGAYERAKCGGVLVNRVGTPGNDLLRGTRRRDGILALGGRDRLLGRGGGDGLCGGRGRDALRGGGGDDVLDGGRGRDRCAGGPGTEVFRRCEVVLA